ncbi:MAG: T9SS type A sorting domain-containing protein, partial [Bacteroidota bacterium]
SLPYPYPNCEFACPPDSPYGVEQRAGDLLCDTPADPYRGDDTPCMASPDGCTYTGMLANGDTIRDLNGQLYQPDESNYMSYYNCRSSFTPGQYDRMLYFFLNGHFNGADCVENITEEVLRMPAGDPVRNVDAFIQHFKETDCSDDGDCELDFVTPADGTFLYNCSVQGAVKARLVKEDAWLNGVSIRDVYLLSRHILEIEPLNDWNLLAADVNNSGSVTAYDMVLIRQLVLFVIQELPIGNGDNGNDATPWRFVPEKIAADHPSHFDNEPYVNNPFNVKDDNGNVLYPNYLSSNYCYEPAREKMGFRAVKAGDVNGSATAQNAMGTTTSSSRKANLLFANPRSLAAGEEFTVSLTAKQFEKVAGYGFGLSLHTDQVELMQIREGSLADFDLNNFGSTHLDQGELRAIWMDKELSGKSLSEDESLFQLQLKAKVDVDNWQSTISIHPSSIAFDFFDHDLNEVDVQLVAKIEDVSQTTANIYEVLAFPNPAHQNFSFQLESPQDGEVQVQLYDVNGRLLLQHQQGCKLGKNQFSVPFFSSLPSGTYFYQVSNSQFSHRGRVVKME